MKIKELETLPKEGTRHRDYGGWLAVFFQGRSESWKRCKEFAEIQMWVGRHGKVGELALEGTAKLLKYHDGPCPAERSGENS